MNPFRRRSAQFELSGRTVLVTGAAHGIGRATALKFAQYGAALELIDVDERGLSEVQADCLARGAPRVFIDVVDVSDAGAVEECAKRVHERYDAVDVIVNNAGVGLAGGLLDAELDDVRWVMGVNLWGTMHVIRAFAPCMKEAGRGGRIVNVVSVAAFLNTAAFTVYGASKYAQLGLSEGLREELAPYGIGVSAVCPAFVDTSLTASMRLRGQHYCEEERSRIREFYRRYGISPERVAASIVSAVREDSPVVPVAAMAHAIYYLKRFLPGILPLLVRSVTRSRPTDPRNG